MAVSELKALQMAQSILEGFQDSSLYDDYKAADGFTDEEYDDMLAQFRRMTNDQEGSALFTVTEQNSESENPGSPVKVRVAAQSGQLYLYPEGYGENGAATGFGSPYFLDMWDGELRVVLCTDINSQDQQIISIEGSREDRLIEDEA